MKRLILVRHGESEGNVDPSIYMTKQDHEVALTEKGRQDSIEAGVKLNEILLSHKEKNLSNLVFRTDFKKEIKMVAFISPFLRTRETWQIMETQLDKNINYHVVEDLRLMEKKWELFKTKEDMDKFVKSPDFTNIFYRNNNAEALVDVSHRIASFVDSLVLRSSLGMLPDNVVIVSHWWALALMTIYLKQKPYEDFFGMKIKNCDPLVIDIKDTWIGKTYK